MTNVDAGINSQIIQVFAIFRKVGATAETPHQHLHRRDHENTWLGSEEKSSVYFDSFFGDLF